MKPLNFGGTRLDGSATLRLAGSGIGCNFFGQSSFASHALAREHSIIKLLDGLPLESSGTLGCGFQTGAGAIMRSLACRAGSTLIVLGGGSVGLSAVMGAAIQDCGEILVVEPHAARRDLALSLGASRVLDPTACDDLAEAVRAILPAGADYVLDTSGRAEVLERVPEILATRGTCGFVGMPSIPSAKLPGFIGGLMQRGLTYRGIVEGDSDPETFIPQLMSLYLEGRFPFEKLVSKYPLIKINQAVDDQHNGACVKAVLIP